MSSSIIFKVEMPEEAFSLLIKKELQNFFTTASLKKQEEKNEILTLNESCELLSCSKSLIYKLTASRQIPHSKRGKKLYFERKKLLEWMTENQVKTRDEIREDAVSLITSRKRRNDESRK